MCLPDRKVLLNQPSCKSVHIWCDGPNKQRHSPRQQEKDPLRGGTSGETQNIQRLPRNPQNDIPVANIGSSYAITMLMTFSNIFSVVKKEDLQCKSIAEQAKTRIPPVLYGLD